jgi:hypothetical protein
MTMLSFLSSDDVFLQLFSADGGTDSTENTVWTTLGFEQAVDIYKMEEWFEKLQRYSLVQWKRDQQSYAMHKLVHAWGYDRLTADDQGRFGLATLELVIEAVNRCGSRPQDKTRLVPHIMASFSAVAGAGSGLSQTTSEIGEGTLDELESVGRFVINIGRWSEGRVIEGFVLNERARLLGGEHPSTITAMANLAATLGDQGQLNEAAQMKKEVL